MIVNIDRIVKIARTVRTLRIESNVWVFNVIGIFW